MEPLQDLCHALVLSGVIVRELGPRHSTPRQIAAHYGHHPEEHVRIVFA
jgi:hypothetical protein